MDSNRIKAIQAKTAYPESRSVKLALEQVWHEVAVKEKCKWVRTFDSHFNIGCVNQTGERANGSFKKVEPDEITQWDFVYCPYCGGKIETVKTTKFKERCESAAKQIARNRKKKPRRFFRKEAGYISR